MLFFGMLNSSKSTLVVLFYTERFTVDSRFETALKALTGLLAT
jgi:hypothetical protein